jgi:hypothetical protein
MTTCLSDTSCMKVCADVRQLHSLQQQLSEALLHNRASLTAQHPPVAPKHAYHAWPVVDAIDWRPAPHADLSHGASRSDNQLLEDSADSKTPALIDGHHFGSCSGSAHPISDSRRGRQTQGSCQYLSHISDCSGSGKEQCQVDFNSAAFKECRGASMHRLGGSAAGRARLPGRPSPRRVFRALDAAYLAASAQLDHESGHSVQ